MTIKLILRNQEFILEKEVTVKQAMQQVGVSPESHFIVRDGELLTEDERLYHGDIARLVAVISGGFSR